MKIDHIAMYVNDLEAAKEFFEHYLNGHTGEKYHNPRTGFSSYFISFDGETRLEIMTREDLCDDEKKEYRTGYIHIAFSVGSEEGVNRLTEKFREDGYHIVSGPRTTGDGYYESCIVGLEGNLIEITV